MIVTLCASYSQAKKASAGHIHAILFAFEGRAERVHTKPRNALGSFCAGHLIARELRFDELVVW